MTRPYGEQHRLHYRGRDFHFVSYAGQPANPKRSQPAGESSWWLMSSGTRWKVMPFEPGRDAAELDRAFVRWLDAHVFQSSETSGA